MKNNGHRISYELAISDELTIKISADSLNELLKRANAQTEKDPDGIEFLIADYVRQKLQEYVYKTVLTDEYKEILKRDAQYRMVMDDSLVDPSIGEFVSWCWEKNAGHWLDGTPITDD